MNAPWFFCNQTMLRYMKLESIDKFHEKLTTNQIKLSSWYMEFTIKIQRLFVHD